MGHVSTTSTTPSLPVPTHAVRLREALLAADFTADGLLDLLGAQAYAALARSETVPALRATRGDSPLETLVRLFLLQRAVEHERAAAALPLAEALADGWVVREDDTVLATVDVRPYGGPDGEDWFIVSDLGCAVGGAGGIGKKDEGVVLGVGGASTTLAGITVRTPVATALDLGTGSGIQALHAAQHATLVTATDLNPRALDFTRLTLALSGARGAELLTGSLFEPVDGDTYDLIVSNPPFVISPGAGLTYRDGGMGGDDLCRTLVQEAGERLNDGGYAQFLANWQHVEGEEWQDRLRSWVPRGCDAWIVQREVQDVTQYTELWLRDSGDHRGDPAEYRLAYGRWLDEFEARRTRGIGFGWITLRKSAAVAAGRPSPRSSSRSGRTPSSSPSATRSGPTSSARTTCAAGTTRPCSPTVSPSRPRWSRSRSGCPEPRTPSTCCCARTGGCAGPPGWTTWRPASRASATARSAPAGSSTPSASSPARTRSSCGTVPRRRSGSWWRRASCCPRPSGNDRIGPAPRPDPTDLTPDEVTKKVGSAGEYRPSS